MQSSLNYSLSYSQMEPTNSRSVTGQICYLLPKRWPECPLKDPLSYHYLGITFYGRNGEKFQFWIVKYPQRYLHSGATYQARNNLGISHRTVQLPRTVLPSEMSSYCCLN